MSSKQLPTSPGSEVDERKRKRKLSNRESARRSRMRKQQHLGELSAQVTQLEEENKKVRKMIDGASDLYINFATDNNVLRAQMAELTDRLRSLNSVLQIASEVSGMVLDIPDIPDNLLEPWQLPCPIHPISTSADMFQYSIIISAALIRLRVILAVVLQRVGFLLLVSQPRSAPPPRPTLTDYPSRPLPRSPKLGC